MLMGRILRSASNFGLPRCNVILVLLLLLIVPSTASAQLTPEQALSVRHLSDLNFSPDGRHLAFVVAEPPKGSEHNSDLWLLETASRTIRQLTFSPRSDTSPRWSPAGQQLAFLSDREEEKTQIYLLPLAGGEAVRLTGGKNAIQSFEWSPDGLQIAFVAEDPKTESEEQKEKNKDDARVVDSGDHLRRLWVVDVESKQVRQLTGAKWRVGTAKWFPGGERILVSATDRPESDDETERIYAVALSDGAMTLLDTPHGPFSMPAVSRDGKQIAYAAARNDGPSPHDLYVKTLGTDRTRNMTGDAVDRPVEHFVWLKDGTFLASVASGFRNLFMRIAADGRAQAVPGCNLNPSDFTVADDGNVAFVGENATRLPEIWLWKGSADPEKVTRFNESGSGIALIQPELIQYKSFDGTTIEASLLKPAGYRENTRVPLVVLAHGGPTWNWSDRFDAWGQLLASRGFAVLSPNVRGSTGYGQRFLESNRADWGGGDFKDVMAGVDYLIERGIADPNRLGIGGWSYGGYMAAWAVTQTNRFKAAVAGAGMSDLASEFGTEEKPAYDRWFYGLPYEGLDKFVRNSPIAYIKNARTPTLILQGEADTIDPIGQSQQLYRGLKYYGVKSELVLYPREGHGIREEKHQLDIYRRVITWFETYLK
jgi:dipeptidyl aminopeptidase/acylaminoacyl peptidase